jgi:hypothetical protein
MYNNMGMRCLKRTDGRLKAVSDITVVEASLPSKSDSLLVKCIGLDSDVMKNCHFHNESYFKLF